MNDSQIILNWTQIIFLAGSVIASAGVSLVSIVWFSSNLKNKVDAIDSKVTIIENDLEKQKIATDIRLKEQDTARAELKDMISENYRKDELFKQEMIDTLRTIRIKAENSEKSINEFKENISRFFQANKDIINPNL